MSDENQVFLSAGCAGLWYFEWIEKTWGPIKEHLGIEFYSPKPENLPANVRWIVNTAADMTEVRDAHVDVLFSGQNIEHLWPDEQYGFLLEAARVTRPGGLLIMDSPNRLITCAMGIAHPEHTVEWTPAEAERVLHLAGFDTVRVAGIWLCRDPRTGKILPADPGTACTIDCEERIAAGGVHAEHSMLWWLEGRRAARAPRPDKLRKEIARIFSVAWPERLQRLAVPAERRVVTQNDRQMIMVGEGDAGVVFFGPYVPLPAGRYQVAFHLGAFPPGSDTARYDIVRGSEMTVIAAGEIEGGATRFAVEFELVEMTFGVQFRCIGLGNRKFSIEKRVSLNVLSGDGSKMGAIKA